MHGTLAIYGPETDIYEVDRLIDRRLDEDGIWRYKVVWKNYPRSEDS